MWRGLEDVEYATLEWVACFNTQRRLEPLGDRPAEFTLWWMTEGAFMARIVLGSYVVSYPVGGFLSWTLQWLTGFHRLGHEVYLVEKSGSWRNPCFDMATGTMGDDCSGGFDAVASLLSRFGLAGRLCFVDGAGRYFGLSRQEVEAVFRSADLYLDISGGLIHTIGNTWLNEAAAARLRVCVDGEPGYLQMLMEQRLDAGDILPAFDHYFSVGRNVGTARSNSPTANVIWRPVFDPVNVDLFPLECPRRDSPFTTVMAWQSHKRIEFKGVTYGQKDMEFPKFLGLPQRTTVPMEVAAGGKEVPAKQLREAGWRVRESHAVTASFDAFGDYIRGSRGEFTVCKQVFVATNCGWFSDRSAAYLASGRPVVMQETGFSDHLPTGRGLFAVRTVDEAADAINRINSDYEAHAAWAREIAIEYLDAGKVLPKLLSEVGI